MSVEKKELKNVFVRAKHIYMYGEKRRETVLTSENTGLETINNCLCVAGNFLNFNVMPELSDKLNEAAAEIKDEGKEPITLSVSYLLENGDTRNYYEAVVVISSF